MFENIINELRDKINDTMEELNWWRGYAENIEIAIEEMQDLMNESTGVAGFHLNGAVAPWDELMNDSVFDMVIKDIKTRKQFKNAWGHVTTETRNELYIKDYKDLPVTVQYTPVYGGVKYIRADSKKGG